MIDSISARTGWCFVLVSTLLLAGFWYARASLGMAWAGWAYLGVAGVVSIAALVVAVSAFLEAGGGGPREWHALSDLYALAGDTPWWGKAVVVLGAVAWGPGPWGWL